MDPNDDEIMEFVPMALPLDRATIVWLSRMACDDTHAAELVASMVRSISGNSCPLSAVVAVVS